MKNNLRILFCCRGFVFVGDAGGIAGASCRRGRESLKVCSNTFYNLLGQDFKISWPLLDGNIAGDAGGVAGMLRGKGGRSFSPESWRLNERPPWLLVMLGVLVMLGMLLGLPAGTGGVHLALSLGG